MVITETRAFVRGVLLDGGSTHEPMSIADAEYNIMCWKRDGVELPDGMNASILRYVWNEEVN